MNYELMNAYPASTGLVHVGTTHLWVCLYWAQCTG